MIIVGMEQMIEFGGLSLSIEAEEIRETRDDLRLSGARVSVALPKAPRRVYRHGWQSWSPALWTEAELELPVQRPRILHPMQIDPRYADVRRAHGSWVTAAELEDGSVLLIGALGTDAHLRWNGARLEGWFEAGSGEWLLALGDEQAVFADYVELLAERFGRRPEREAPRVWCSWYSLYTAIDEPILHRIFDDLGDLPFDVLQVDDGWQRAVGDWAPNSKFPSGMAALAERIKSSGRQAGLWLAPLIAVKSSALVREHADWFLRGANGRLVSAGFNWGEPLYALDTTHPAVLDWLQELMRQVRTWGFDYVKLDFLYAGALPGKRHIETAREAAYRQGLAALRESMGEEAFFLACGAPIVPSLGLCDALRIGPDVAAEWESRRDARQLNNLTTPGTKNAIRTSVNRLWLSALVRLDPDVAYFRSKECDLTRKEKSYLQDLALICGFRATSDLPQWLTRKERQDLKSFLTDRHKPRRIDRHTFQIGKRQVDFGPCLDLPEPAQGAEAVRAALLGWLGNQGWALSLFDRMGKRGLERTRKDLDSGLG